MTICTTSYIVEAGENPHPTWEMIGAWVADTFAPSSDHQCSLLGTHGCHLYVLVPDSAFKAHAFGHGPSKRCILRHRANGKDASSGNG